MAIVSTFCKKGGVGKTTFIGYLAHYYALQGKTVLVISADDQNSVFKIFGVEDQIYNNDSNYLEHLLAGLIEPKDVVYEARINMYLIKTLNTDKLSMRLTLERSQEKRLKDIMNSFKRFFDYIFIDFPPSSSRLTEVLLDISDDIIIVVGLDSLGMDGYLSTIQYFVDSDIDVTKINYIVPTGYHKVKIAPNKYLNNLVESAKKYTPSAKVITPISEKSVIQNLQSEGISIFDNYQMSSNFHQKNRDQMEEEMREIFSEFSL